MAHLLLLRGAMGAGKSATAAKLREHLPKTVVIEIDDIKLQNNGTTEKCKPDIDFTEAGAQARKAMDAGNNVIVIEPLCEQRHVQYVLQGADLLDEPSNVSSIWLHCSLETAIKRKQQAFRASVIRSQHQRYADRFQLNGENIICTDHLSVDEVAKQVIQCLEECHSKLS